MMSDKDLDKFKVRQQFACNKGLTMLCRQSCQFYYVDALTRTSRCLKQQMVDFIIYRIDH